LQIVSAKDLQCPKFNLFCIESAFHFKTELG
jgi:hypothetical protein